MRVVIRKFVDALFRFRRREDGIMVTELTLTLPIFMFCIIGAYSYWDGYRTLNTAQKATYTIADLLSRETKELTLAKVNGLHDMMEYLMGDRTPVKLRITSVLYSGVRDRFEVAWSRSPRNEMLPLTTSTLQAYKSKIPEMSDGKYVILVEAELDFKPAFAQTPEFFMFLDDRTFRQFIVTPPRWIPKLCMENVYCG